MRMSGPEKNEAVPAEPAVIIPKKRRWPWLVLVFLLAAAGVIWHFRLYEPYLPEPAEETAEPVPETILFEAYPTPVQEYGTAFRPVQVVRAHDGELSVQKEPDMTRIGEQTAASLVRKKRDDGSDPLADLIGVRVLILDDLGQKATGTAWLTDILFRIIDKRYQARRTMIVTSNVPLPELDFDDRIVDRLNAMTLTVRLPEYCIRAREANTRKKAVLEKFGIR